MTTPAGDGRPDATTEKPAAEPAEQPGTTGASGSTAALAPAPSRFAGIGLRIVRGEPLVVIVAFIVAFLIGSVLILISDQTVRETAGYLFARPSDFFGACWNAIVGAYTAMFRGAVFDGNGFSRAAERVREDGGSGMYVWGPALARGFKPLTETLTVATPLIIASCGIAVSFRAGLFNIGGTGQLILGAVAATWVGFAIDLPPVIHLLAAIIAGVLAGGAWGAISGFLKARFGANEVITTIMLNWIAVYGLGYLLTTPAFIGTTSTQPISKQVADDAKLPLLLGSQFRLNWGLLIALLSIVFLWWLMSRSTLGFRFRAVGSNPRAAEVAGIDTGRSALGVMAVAGALVGLAGAAHVLGTEYQLNGDIAGSIGFDAITVALLGRSGPVGILLAGLLFAGLSTGGAFMETAQGVPKELVQVIQALVVLFIAAPPMMRALIGMNRRPRAPKNRRPGRGVGDPATAQTAPAQSATVSTPGAVS